MSIPASDYPNVAYHRWLSASALQGDRLYGDVHAPMEPFFMRPVPAWKRGMDIVGALVGLTIFSIPLAIIALLVKLTSRGPVFYVQERAGHGGEGFKLYKFRTMVEDAEKKQKGLLEFNERTGPVFKMKSDPRVTSLGRILRLSSLDELPQFFNVLIGEMSLVGPRPLPLKEERALERWHHERRDVRPGITGIWQATSREESCIDSWMRLDIQYVREISFWLDVKLLLMTIPSVVLRKGAVE